ncbi:hypothetical protein B0H13DRAFT_2017708 [Mycena leptocephala]|nr:hypothetical protein B0H13DRAFT_2017708 [Mycena leptocephala]
MSSPRSDWSSPPPYDAQFVSASQRNNSSRSDTVNLRRAPEPASEPRYVYYRVYSLDGMLPCAKKYGSNPFIGRIKATSVPPPHTVASLKRALVQAEGLPDPNDDLTGLFETRDAQTAMVTNARVAISTGDLGATAQTPVALVFLTSPKEALYAASEDDEQSYAGKELPLLYYRLYNLDTSEPALGRVKRESIPPPRNVLAVKRRIARAEGKPIYQMADLFTDVTADNARPSNALVDDACGSSKENPILIVQPERRPGLYNRPVQIVALPQDLNFSGYGFNNGHWLSPSVGDTLLTDGVARYETESYTRRYVYTAVNTSGRTGWISARMVVHPCILSPD